MASAGLALLLGYWLPRILFRRPPSATALLMLTGLAAFHLVPGMPQTPSPVEAPALWERTSELVVIIVLFATGLRIDEIPAYRRWRPTIRLLAVSMPVSIAAVALLGVGFVGMSAAGAVILGAVLAPTDPVLAGDVQVGPPLEGGEHPVRFTLTTEAGLNDGLAFPFVALGLVIAADGLNPSAWGLTWLLQDVLYRVGIGAALGALIGWALGRILFTGRFGTALADTGPGVIALAGVLICYGAVELAEGYGFIAVFVAGLVCRRVEAEHLFHRRLHNFSEAIEQAITAVLLVLLGSILPALWPYLDWQHAVLGLGLLLVIRPLSAWLCLLGTDLVGRERAVTAFFGVRGVGSIYYLGYAARHGNLAEAGQAWALVAFTILASSLLHGLTARPLVHRVIGSLARAPASPSPSSPAKAGGVADHSAG